LRGGEEEDKKESRRRDPEPGNVKNGQREMKWVVGKRRVPFLEKK